MELLKKVARYRPFLVLILIAILSASAHFWSMGGGLYMWTQFFMGMVFCSFAMLKLFHIKGFVDGFRKYDLVASRFPAYGYCYPFIELLLGLAYFAFAFPMIVYLVTVVLMGVSAVGVVKALRKGLDVRCACMGTILDVPLSTVTLTEDVVMGVMALIMLINILG